MREIKCLNCKGICTKYGKTRTGKQRWHCGICNIVFTEKVDNNAKQLQIFLGWLFSKQIQTQMPSKGRTFRYNTSKFWQLWTLPPKIEERSKVAYVDGIYLARNLCVLICCDNTHVLGWYVCRHESTKGWEALLSRIAAPELVVSDGGSGFRTALRRVWPHTLHQRCLFHAFGQVKRYTTTKPKTPAGRELYKLAQDLLYVKNKKLAAVWLTGLHDWRIKYNDFLKEMTRDEYGHLKPTHERLLRAEASLLTLVKENTLFTFLIDSASYPAMNNRIEGGVNSLLRDMLRNHRGLILERRLKAVYWWCYMHSPNPLSIAEILKTMPTDDDIQVIYSRLYARQQLEGAIPKWGTAAAWGELHMSTTNGHRWD